LACVAAANTRLRLAQASRAAQILKSAGFVRPQQDTLPTAVVAVARACGARFTLETTPKVALPALFRLALLEMNDTLAHAVLTHLVAQETTPTGKGTQFLWGITQYLAAVPTRVSAAEAIAAHMDAQSAMLGGEAWHQRVQAHQALVDFAHQSADWPLVRRQGTLLLALARTRLADGGLDVLGKTYQALLQVAWLEQPDSIETIATQLRADLSPPAVQQATTGWCRDTAALNRAFCLILRSPALSREAATRLQLPITDTTPLAALTTAMLGLHMHAPQDVPPLRADFWFPPSGTDPVDSLHPTPAGRVSLIYHVRSDWRGIGSCFNGCSGQLMGQLLALCAQYGNQLAVTMVVDAEPYTVLHVPAPPDTVAESWRWYFQDYLQIPAAVAVRTLPVANRQPPPDGRIAYASRTPTYNDVYTGPQVVIVANRQGKAVYDARDLELAGSGARVHLARVVEHEVAAR
jgi:hypothetical protein